MLEVQNALSTAIVKDSTGAPMITVAHVSALAVGMLGLYLMIPERKRKNLFK